MPISLRSSGTLVGASRSVIAFTFSVWTYTLGTENMAKVC